MKGVDVTVLEQTTQLTHKRSYFNYEQMTSNPAFTERNVQKRNAYLLDSRLEQTPLITYHTLQSLYVCVWPFNTLTSTAPIGSPIICM